MLKNDLKEKIDFDRTVEEKANGVYTLPSIKDVEKFKIRDLIKYCKENSKDISKISDKEMLLFL